MATVAGDLVNPNSGRWLASLSDSDWGSVSDEVIGCRSKLGSWTINTTNASPTKLSSRVVMISLVPRRT